MSLLTIPAIYENGVLHAEVDLPRGRWKVLVTFLEVESADFDNPLAVEEAAFASMHAKLKEQYLGEYVAVLGSTIIDHDADLGALSSRVYQKYGNRPILITLVNAVAD